MKILSRSSFRFHLKHPVLLILTLLGIVLGVAIVVGIFLMTKAASNSLEQSVTQLQGPVTHQITGVSGKIPETIYAELLKAEVVSQVTPIFQGTLSVIHGARTVVVTLMGLDPMSHPLFPGPFPWPVANETLVLASEGSGFKEGDVLTSSQSSQKFRVWKTIPLPSQTLITDIEFAQILPSIKLDRLELHLEEIEVPRVQDWVKKHPEIRLDSVAAVLEGQQKMMGSFQLGLKALSFLALVVGMFLIYNTMNFSVELRKAHFGTLRLLGVRKDEIFFQISVEALALGGTGGLLGVLLGEQLSSLFIGKVLQTVNDLYFSAAPVEVALSMTEKTGFIFLGLGSAWIASTLPALDAMLAPPRISLSKSLSEERFRGLLKKGIPLLSIFSLALGYALMTALKHEGLFASLFLTLLGLAVWIPMIIELLTRSILHVVPRAMILLRLSLDATQRHLARTGIAVTALSLAFAVSLGMEQMVSSFRKEMISWLDTYVHADLYIAPFGYSTSRSEVTFSTAIVRALTTHPLVQDYSSQRHVSVQSNLGKLRLVALRPSAKIESLFRTRKAVDNYSWNLLATQPFVAISEALSHRLHLTAGQPITIATPEGEKTYSVAAIFTDYVTDQGLLFMDHNEYLRQFHDPLITTIHLFLKDPSQPEAARDVVQDIPGFAREARVTTQQQVKGGSIVIFDRTFQITEALRILAVAISMIGLFSALMAIQLGRIYEIGVQRAMGLLPFEIFCILTLQNLWLGLLTGILAIPLSQYIAWFLGSVLNPRSFGWTIPTQLSWEQALVTLAFTLISSFIAGLYPSFQMSRVSLAETLKERSEI